MRVSTFTAGASALALAATLAAAPAQAHGRDRHHDREPEVVASGLVGPLSLTVGQGNDVYVSQSFAGVLSKIDKHGDISTVTAVDPETGSVSGVDWKGGKLYYLEGDFSGEVPDVHVAMIDKRGNHSIVSDNLWEHEIANNPDAGASYGFVGLGGSCADQLAALEAGFPEELAEVPFLQEYGGIVESNPYQLVVDHDGTIYVADAAANAVVEVDRRTGAISTVSVIPATPIQFTEELEAMYEGYLEQAAAELEIEMDTDVPDCLVGQTFTPEPVPTDVQLGRQDTLYVSTLQGGAGELLPLSKVYAVDARSGAASEVAGGMHGATGLAVLPNGHMFVAELFGGEVSIIRRGSSTAETLFAADSPADVAVQGAFLYATTGVFGDGSVVRYHHPMAR